MQNTPVLAGVCATDPYRNIPNFLQDLKALGFCGVQNFPTVGLIDGNFRRDLEATGMSYEMEVAMIRTARQMDLVTTPYVFNIDEGVRMTKAGADVVVVHLGLTTGGSIGAEGRQGRSLDDCIGVVQEVRDACVEVNPDVIVLCHGGPVSGEWQVYFLGLHADHCIPYQASKTRAMFWKECMAFMDFSAQAAWRDCQSRPPSKKMHWRSKISG